ncbi:MAG: hypothetical protein R3242_08640 [Akkermansiaceae bacterium]|nr:hypothetical protein [Akkermansiaceae bacterium]
MKLPTHKRMVDPVGLGTPKLFAEKESRPGEPLRDKPLPGVKRTLTDCDNGRLTELFTRKPEEAVACPLTKAFAWVAMGMSGALLGIGLILARFVDSGALLLVFWLCFCIMHLCVIFSQVMSDSGNGTGLMALAVFYGGLLLWFLTEGLLP